MWLVFIVIGLALAGFVIMDMVSASQQGGVAGATTIGKVNGTKLDYRDFNTAESSLYSGSEDPFGAKQAVWEYLVDKAIIDKEAELNGLFVPSDELKNLLFGSNPAPIIRTMYTDPATGQFNRQALLEVRQAIESGQMLNPTFETRWAEVEKQVNVARLGEKLNALVSKGMYTPTWMVEFKENLDNSTVDFDFIKIPFDFIKEEISVSDNDILAHIKGKESRFKVKNETRTMLYLAVDVLPTREDSLRKKEEMSDLVEEFRTTDNDSLFSTNNNGFYSPYYNSKEDLPESIKEVVPGMQIGDVYGPYEDNNNYFAVKLTDRKIVPDSVKARHILRSTDLATGGVALVEAQKYIDSLKVLLETRKATFDSLAIRDSQDPGSSFNGGDLGTFAQGSMVQPFNDACFHGSKKGGLYVVTTQFGVHLIEVQDIIFNDYDYDFQLAFIRSPIIPSEETQNQVQGQMLDHLLATRKISDLQNLADGNNKFTLQKGGPFEENDYEIPGLGGDQTSREIIKWLFDKSTKKGQVSPELYSYSDPVNYYDNKFVIVSLEEIIPAGLPPTVTLRNRTEAEIISKKKGEMIASQINSKDMNVIAGQFSVQIDSLDEIRFSANMIPGIGNEPKVLATAFRIKEGEVSDPVIGNNGVYVIRLRERREAGSPSNVPLARSAMNSAARTQVSFRLMESLRKEASIEDGRSKFF